MKYLFSLLIITLIASSNLSGQELKTAEDSLAYAFGLDLAREIQKKNMTDLNTEIMRQAIDDVIAGRETKINEVDARTFVATEKRARNERMGAANREAGLAFLAEKAKQPGVMELTDGILYEIIKPGMGAKPAKGSDVTLHYEGKLITGEVFDSSYDRGAPSSFNLNRLIKGWQIAVPNMKEGAKWRLYLPYQVAYGQRAAGSKIKPYSTLIFDIELIENK